MDAWDDEEPLFADDINSDDDDDPPPLPPPMPPLSQLSQPHSRTHTGTGGEGGSGDGDNWDTPRGETTTDGEQATPTQKKRAPILTLTIDRIFSEKGLPHVEKEFPKLKFKGKGHEATDLKYLLQQYEHWANSLYPKLTFKDVTDRIEKLATKKEFKTQLIQMRRRWARGPTPPIRDEEDGDITTNHHHDNNPSDNHHHSNSPTQQQSEVESISVSQPNASESRQETNSESESENDMLNSSHHRSPSRHNDRGRLEEGRDDLDDLLMGESDILRESRQCHRDSHSSSREDQHTHNAPVDESQTLNGSQGSDHTREQAKRSKVLWEAEEMEGLLTEEEQLMMEISDSHIPRAVEF